MNGLLKQISSNRYHILRLVGKKLTTGDNIIYLIDKVSFEEDMIYFISNNNALKQFAHISHCTIRPDGYYWYDIRYYIVN